MSESQYDTLYYPDYLHPQTHPRRLQAVSLLLGHDAPDLKGARVLELGASSGTNLIAMAMGHPEASFVGVDLAAKRVEEGLLQIHRVGLKNVELKVMSATQIDPALGLFDYIIAHGLFSWVPAPVRAGILQTCAQSLTPKGVAFISYNIFPGWAHRWLAGHFMRGFSDPNLRPAERARQARELLSHLVETTDGVLHDGYEIEAKRLNEQPNGYLFHEYMGAAHHPYFFRDFVGEARDASLEYLGESESLTYLDPRATARDTGSGPPDFGGDVIEAQQYIDFAEGRYFRQSLLFKAGQGVGGMLSRDALPQLHITADVRILLPLRLHSDLPERLQVGEDEVREGRPLLKAAYTLLGETWPAAISFDDLLRRARGLLGRKGKAGESVDRQALHDALYSAYLADRIHLEGRSPRLANKPSSHPVASPLARHQLARGDAWLSTLRHDSLTVDDATRLLLPLLDGSRDLDTLVHEVGHLLPNSGPFGRAVGPGRMGVRSLLDLLAKAALLIG